MAYTIAEAAKRSGLSIFTLRFYDKEGLMPYVQRNESGIRQFTESDFEWLKIITCLKDSGIPLKKIRQFVDWAMEGDSTIGLRLEFMCEQKKHLEQQMEELKKHMEVVDHKIWYYETAAEAGTTAIHHEDKKPDVHW